jgi:lipopolysaccharide/colanic/teichoic acid biosynthesis glycosyltransferase
MEASMRAIKDEFGFYREKIFDDMLQRERKRTERSQKPFAMILVHIRHLVKSKAKKSIRNLSVVLEECFREIDIKGWYKDRSDIGIICPEVEHSCVGALKKKVESALDKALPPQFREELTVTFICFPHANSDEEATDKALSVYPEFKTNSPKKITEDILKRSLDIIVAVVALAVSFPIFVFFSVMIKATSPGPVFFKQKRIGFGGRPFTLLKFRTMHVNNDDSVHQKFVKDFIKAKNTKACEETKAFKIVKDKRITPVGHLLRKTSLDELPQFINVLLGNMSVVGPRPPIQYEVDEYHIWHRRRVMEVKPGITGFWQVHGRSSTSFETMVRMDIYYIKYHNIFLDIRLILQTPLSLLKGAY